MQKGGCKGEELAQARLWRFEGKLGSPAQGSLGVWQAPDAQMIPSALPPPGSRGEELGWEQVWGWSHRLGNGLQILQIT